jgi:hypothetical protein
MTQRSSPDMDLLVACGGLVAEAMRQPPPDPVRAGSFFHAILLTPWDQGGRDLWEGFREGLITEEELRDATMAYFATWLSHANGVDEPSSETWSRAEINGQFELALFGYRPCER